MWTKNRHQQGHGWASWEICSEVLPHVNYLMELVNKHKLKATDSELFAELIFQTGKYLWKREQLTAARSFFTFGLSLHVDLEGPTCNPAVRLLGHIALDMGQPRLALEAYQEALAAQLNYTDTDKVTQAFEYLDKAVKTHQAKNPHGMARTGYKTLPRKRSPGPSTQSTAVILSICHASDVYAQGNKEAALKLASKSITMRKGILGSKGPRVAHSMYLISSMRRDEWKEALAAKLLRGMNEMSRGMVDMEGYLGRALWTLGRALWTLGRVEEEIGNRDEAKELRRKARDVRGRSRGGRAEDEDGDTDEGFSRLVGYMLW
ncbi:MAG: hypothetical protein M1830_002335 [Pleopsidium flavum]|nr:MAG: hypothetical protein M1830_002335 [Pleopsidium flavum]